MSKILMVVTLLLPLTAYANESYIGNSLCVNDESIHFTCILENKKTVSVCGSSYKEKKHEYAQYKYGNQNHIEMVYPQKKSSGIASIFYVDASGGSVTADYLFFRSGSYKYTLAYTPTITSLFVENKSGNEIFLSHCIANYGNKNIADHYYDGNWESIFQNGFDLY